MAEKAEAVLVDQTQLLPERDSITRGLADLLELNRALRRNAWPKPFDATRHCLRLGDARDLSWIRSGTIHLVVTSPPYWVLKEYHKSDGQLGDVQDYDQFLNQLDKVWRECLRVLVPGGRICCVVGDVCVPRKKSGHHYVVPLHADIQVRCRKIGLDCLTPILWHKIGNGVNEAQGNGAGFYGKPFQPGAVVRNEIEHLLFFRKPGGYRSVTNLQKALSMLTRDEMKAWFRSFWTDIQGASTRAGHPAPFPTTLAERLIRMFSFAGDTVLDPFVGTGTTCLAAINTGRNSVGVDVESKYLRLADKRLRSETAQQRFVCSTKLDISREGF